MKSFVTLFLLTLLAPACGVSAEQSALDESMLRWQQADLSDYRFTYERWCECDIQPVIIDVRGQAVESAVYVQTGASVATADLAYLPTIDDLFTVIQEGIDASPYTMSVTYDPQYGYPASISIDYDNAIADEEFLAAVSDFQLLSAMP